MKEASLVRHVTRRGGGTARRRKGLFATAASLVAAGGLVLGAVGAAGVASASTTHHTKAKAKYSASNPRHGGSVTVFEGTGYAGSWPGLDPATDTDGAANQDYMNAIFGDLFELGAHGATIDDLATGYRFTNGGKTVNVYLRKGVRFSDGTPFNAAAVVFNWKRDLAGTCSCKPVFTQSTAPIIKQTGPYSLSITLTYVDASFINALQDDIFNWIVSPTALAKMGEKAFSLKPVGAGPFEVVSDTPSSSLVLKKNPHYWQPGLPYLNTLTFKSVANDESALEAMEAGSGQAYIGMSTPQLVKAYKAHFIVTTEPSTSPYDIQLNTTIAPFNNIKAREAIYYATNCQLLDDKLFDDQTPCGESFEAPAGLFYEKTVPGYLTYNLAKAKALVKSLGGLDVNFFTITSPVALTLMEGLQTEWDDAGMHVSIHQYDLSTLIGVFESKKWQAALQTAGAYDPGTGVGVAFRFASTSPFSGVDSPTLDNLLSEAAATTVAKRRETYYNAAAEYIARNADGPFLFPINGYNIAAHGVGGEGLTTPLPSVVVDDQTLWQTVYNNNG